MALPEDVQAMMADFREALSDYRRLQSELRARGVTAAQAAAAVGGPTGTSWRAVGGSGASSGGSGVDGDGDGFEGTFSSGAGIGVGAGVGGVGNADSEQLLRQYRQLRQRLTCESPQLRQRVSECLQPHAAPHGAAGAGQRRGSGGAGSSTRSRNEKGGGGAAPALSATRQYMRVKDYAQRKARTGGTNAGAGAAGGGGAWIEKLGFADMVRRDEREMATLATSGATAAAAAAATEVALPQRQLGSTDGSASVGGVSVTFTGLKETVSFAPDGGAAGGAGLGVRVGGGGSGAAGAAVSAAARGASDPNAGATASARLKAAALAAMAYKRAKFTLPKEAASAVAQAPGGDAENEETAEAGEATESHPMGAAEVKTASGDVYAGRRSRRSDDAEFLMVCP